MQSSQLHLSCCSHCRVACSDHVLQPGPAASAQAGALCACMCVCLYVCLPAKRENQKEWDSKLTEALKVSFLVKKHGVRSAFCEDFFFFSNCCFSCCLQLRGQGVVPVCSAHRTLQLLQLLKHFTHGFLHCLSSPAPCSLCGITDHEMLLPPTRGSACLVCAVGGSAGQRFLGTCFSGGL